MDVTENQFGVFKLNKQLFNAVADKGYSTPTPIQLKAIPALLSGQDLIAISQTGTGKTAAYLLPLIKLLSHAQGNQPRALIVLPTRELVLQVEENFKDFSKYTDLRCTVAYGATGAVKQTKAIENGIDILIATPGRLLELYVKGHVALNKIQFFILDEAERLMDISFISQLYRILEILPRKRKHWLFSATMNELVQRIAHDFIEFPLIINIEPEQKTAATISQVVYMVKNIKSKINLMEYFLKDTQFTKLLVFCKTKETANSIFNYFIRKHGANFARIVHGNKSQQARINAVNEFAVREEITMLIATDVASRGIDITGISHVINFDVPLDANDYVHRIGRTGRALNTGIAITLVNDADFYFLQRIEKLIKQKIEIVTIPDEVKTEPTPFEEKQQMDREIDRQKRKSDPEFAGAFHEKKIKKTTKRKKHFGLYASMKK